MFSVLERYHIKCDLLCILYLTIRFLLGSEVCNRLIKQIFIFLLLNTKLQYCLIARHYALNFKGTAFVEFGEILWIFGSLKLLDCRMNSCFSFQLVGPGSKQTLSWPSYFSVFLLLLLDTDHQEQWISSQTQSVWISIE